MLLIQANKLTQFNGVKIGNEIIIKTRAIDINANSKELIIETIVMLKEQYEQLQAIPEEQRQFFYFEPIQVKELGRIQIPFDTAIISDWQRQNELVKEKLIANGVPETAIQIIEDLTQN